MQSSQVGIGKRCTLDEVITGEGRENVHFGLGHHR